MRTSPSQFEILVSFMEEHGDLNKINKTVHGRIKNIEDWETLSSLLNDDSTGFSRTSEKWKKVWSDLKNNIKKKNMKIAKALDASGRPILNAKLTELEQRVLKVVALSKGESDRNLILTPPSGAPISPADTLCSEGIEIENESKNATDKLRINRKDALNSANVEPIPNIKAWRIKDNKAFLIQRVENSTSSTYTHKEVPSDAFQGTVDIDTEENPLENQESRYGNEETNQSSESAFIDNSTDLTIKRRRHKRKTLNELLNRVIEKHQPRVANRQRERERFIASTTNDFTVNNVKNDPLFHFFISMYETTKRLPTLSQHTIKTNIFSLVSQEESKNLMKCSPRPHSDNTTDPET